MDCHEYADKGYQEAWKGYVPSEPPAEIASFDWVLFLDADEEVSPPLRDPGLYHFRIRNRQIHGIRIYRQVFYLENGFGTENGIDIRREAVPTDKGYSLTGQEPHDMVIVEGPVKTLTRENSGTTYNDPGPPPECGKSFLNISAHEMYQAGRRFRLWDLLT